MIREHDEPLGRLQGHRVLAREVPEAYSAGSKVEALCFSELPRSVWPATPKPWPGWASKKTRDHELRS